MAVGGLKKRLKGASAPVERLVERIEPEIGLAAALAEIHPDQASAWMPLVDKAQARVAAVLSGGKLEAVAAAVAEAEQDLAPIGEVAKTYTVHCAGHAHIDMNWMWSWPETVAVTIDTFATVLRLMDEYPKFKFSQSQASTYRIIEEHRPDLLAKIAKRVKQGRWEVTASHWVEGDKNMAGGESLCRHLLVARQYMKKLFGLKPEDVPIDWSPDTFGHAATVPTYLVRGGVKYLYLHRPGVHTPSKPGAFWWEGPDGSRVLVRNDMALGYNGQITADVAQHMIKFVRETGARDYLFVYGVGDHGGGPTRRDILQGLEMDTWPIFPRIEFSTVRAFYERLEAQGAGLPVVTGELNTEFTGCYTTQTLIKKANAYAENRLVDAEAASALAWAADGLKYPAEAFTGAWQDTLFSHFHDILPGSGVHDTRTYTHGLYQKTLATTSAIETQALRRLASLVDTSKAGDDALPDGPASQVASAVGAGVGFGSQDGRFWASEQSAGHGPRPFVVFNPTAHDREEVVEATVWDNAPGTPVPMKSRTFAVRTPDGKLIPAQVVGGWGYWGHDAATVAFPVKAKGLGYAEYTILESLAADAAPAAPASTARVTDKQHHCFYAPTERSPEGLENDFVRVDLDTATGGLRSLFDKRSGVELIAAGASAPALEYAVERPHGMSAWSIENTGPAEAAKLVALRRMQSGPHKAIIEVDLRVQDSDLTLAYELRAGDPKLYIHLRGTWFQRGTPQTGVPVLRIAFPLALEGAQARYEIPFGAIDRDFNHMEEMPALRWAQVSGTAGGQAAGCVLVNDCKYGHSLQGSTLRLTLIRASYDPDILPEIGQHEVHLALAPFAGEMPVADAIRMGQDLSRALKVVGTDIHEGTLPATGQFLNVGSGPVIVSSVKKAEGESALLVRLFNPTDRKATAKIEPDLLGQLVAAKEVDLLEREVNGQGLKSSASGVSVSVPARGIASVVVKVK